MLPYVHDAVHRFFVSVAVCVTLRNLSHQQQGGGMRSVKIVGLTDVNNDKELSIEYNNENLKHRILYYA